MCAGHCSRCQRHSKYKMHMQPTYRESEKREEKGLRDTNNKTPHNAQCHTGRGDATADVLVSQGHFSKDSHLESNCQKQADIRGRPFQDKGMEQAVKRALTQKKPDKCTGLEAAREVKAEQEAHPEEAGGGAGVRAAGAGFSTLAVATLKVFN